LVKRGLACVATAQPPITRYSIPELSNSANRSIKSGDRSIVALKIPRVAHEFDGGLKLLSERPLAPEVDVGLIESGEGRDAAKDERATSDLATAFSFG
jgi:hypothetical protein